MRILSALLVLGLAACGTQKKLLPDVVVLMLDTTRADHLGPFAESRPAATPFLNELAETSVVFENAWTASTHTSPSTASIFTGLVPPRHGIDTNCGTVEAMTRAVATGETVSGVEQVVLPRSVKTLAEHLSDAGYQTVGMGANITIDAERGFHRGFDAFAVIAKIDAVHLAQELERLNKGLDPNLPSFTFMHFMDPHAPYESRQPWCPHGEDVGRKTMCPSRCRYRSEISFMDAELGKLFERMHWYEDTLVVIVTDHGEEFREHGNIMHRFSVHTELARAGLILRIPGVEPQRSSVPAHHTDILPTVLWALDLPRPELADGIPLIPALTDASTFERPLLTHRREGGQTLWAWTAGPWRLMEELPDRSVKLFHVRDDPKEKHDLAAEHPDVVATLRSELDAYRSRLDPVGGETVRIDITQQRLDELRRLGYVGDEADEAKEE